MEGTLLTVEETVELAPVSTPTPRRRSPRPRAAAKPDAESSENAGAVPESVAAPESTPDGPSAPPVHRPNSEKKRPKRDMKRLQALNRK